MRRRGPNRTELVADPSLRPRELTAAGDRRRGGQRRLQRRNCKPRVRAVRGREPTVVVQLSACRSSSAHERSRELHAVPDPRFDEQHGDHRRPGLLSAVRFACAGTTGAVGTAARSSGDPTGEGRERGAIFHDQRCSAVPTSHDRAGPQRFGTSCARGRARFRRVVAARRRRASRSFRRWRAYRLPAGRLRTRDRRIAGARPRHRWTSEEAPPW